MICNQLKYSSFFCLSCQAKKKSILYFEWPSMSSKYLIIAGACLILGIFGIENTIYWFLFFTTFIFGFVF
jgi:hypothetical protein